MASMITVSFIEPTWKEQGKVWHNPQSGIASVYLNGDWRPFASGEHVDLTYPLTFLIKGVDRTRFIDIRSIRKTDAITSAVDSLSFTICDNDANKKPAEGEEVLVFRKETESSSPELWFAGEISRVTPTEVAPGQLQFEYSVSCTDYKKRFSKNMAVEAFEDKTTAEIIATLLDSYGTEFSGNNVSSEGKTIEKISFNYVPLNRCLEDLAAIDNFEWYIDEEKDLHYFDLGTYYAPYQLTEDDTTGHYRNLKFKSNNSQLRNRVIVRGGVYLSAVYEGDVQEAIQDQTVFKLAYKPHNPVTVYLNTGAGYVEQTLGVDGMISSGVDFVVNYEDKLVKCLDHAALDAGDLLKVTYKYEIQVLTEDIDKESVAQCAEAEGGDGIHSYLISNPAAESVDAAHDIAIAELEQNSFTKIEGSFETDQSGYRSGQTIVVNLPTWGYVGEYIIQQVTSSVRADNLLEFIVVFATKKKTLKDFLVKLSDQSTPRAAAYIGESQETLHDLDRLEMEHFSCTDADPTTEERDIVERPYKWGEDADQGVWNEAQWG